MTLRIQAKPNSNKNEILTSSDTIIVRLKASPVDGKANKELVEYLSNVFAIPKSRIQLINGAASRFKTLHIDDGYAAKVKSTLEKLYSEND